MGREKRKVRKTSEQKWQKKKRENKPNIRERWHTVIRKQGKKRKGTDGKGMDGKESKERRNSKKGKRMWRGSRGDLQ